VLMRNIDHGELDNIIEGYLSSYSGREPLGGLEHRIMSRIHLAEAGRRRKIKLFGYAAALTLASLVFISIVHPRRLDSPQLDPRTTPHSTAIHRAAPHTGPTATATNRAATVRERFPHKHPTPPPQFPTSSPL